jgi:hypothetical protein
MSDYTINVDWDGKDALADSDASKVISGDDFQTEFETVQTAVNSKADLNGSSSEDFAMDNGTVAGTFAITGVPTAPTQSAGNNTTRIATTEFVTTAVANNYAFPIGSIFTTTVAYADSAAVVTAIGGTTWVAFGAGRVLIGAGSTADSQPTPETVAFTAGNEGGEFNHTLTEAEMPAHTHSGAVASADQYLTGSGSNAVSGTTGSTGGDGSHNNLQPYIVVYFWKRTA